MQERRKLSVRTARKMSENALDVYARHGCKAVARVAQEELDARECIGILAEQVADLQGLTGRG